MIIKIKNYLQHNSNLLSFLRFLPYKFRLGSIYQEHKDEILYYSKLSDDEKKPYHFQKLKDILNFAYENIPFYKYHYDANGYSPSSFRTLEDFSDVPIVNKADFKKFDLAKRSQASESPFKVNTGGTSGEPLDFYIDKNAFAREWAYMHTIWQKLDYSYLDLKLTFRGKNNKGLPIKYNVIHNEYVVDAYVPLKKIVDELIKLPKSKKIKYIHGYPSSIYSFCKYLKDNSLDSCQLFNCNLKGVFLGSEYPALHYRQLIESVLKVPIISWYGHSEMSILAYEDDLPFKYTPFQTYGFVESLPVSPGEGRLIGTSYYNKNSPFIRYDTGDQIASEIYRNGILTSFQISSGRVGDIIFDKSGNPISLTALIFGRHHNAFNVIDFIQVEQIAQGVATLYATSKDKVLLTMFDLDNVDILFNLVTIKEPFLSSSGKVPLLIKSLKT